MWDSNKKKEDLNMKTLVNKTILAVVATVLVAGTVFFASCEKEDKAKIDSMETKSINAAEIPEVIPVGTMQNGYLEPALLFDKEEYRTLITEKIVTELGNDYIFEDVSIRDNYPFEIDSVAVLKHTIFNIETGVSYNTFVVLDKNISNDGSVIYYADRRPDGSTERIITCEGTNCQGCDYENGDCSLCKNPEGICKKTNSPAVVNKPEIGWKDIIGWGLTIIGWLVN